MEKILITGANGLIGKNLSKLLIQEGFKVVHLVRKKNERSTIQQFLWNPSANEIDENCFQGVHHIIHLAGENISAGRWTKKRKEDLLKSRVESANLLFKSSEKYPIKTFISASGISIYGTVTSEKIFKEEDEPTNDFLAQLTVEWERAAFQFEQRNVRVATVRTGVVLSKTGGALEKIYKPMKFGFGAALGSGKQYFPWIHISDISGIYLHLIKNDFSGSYNAVADEHVTNKLFTQAAAKAAGKKLFLPNVPDFMLKLLFGEMANIILKGSRISNQKIKNTGYQFIYPDLQSALEDIFTGN